MADTIRTHAAIQVLFANNTVQGISEQDLRDLVESVLGVVPYVAKTANYTATEDDEVIDCDATSGAVTITLPAVATTRVGKKYVIKKTDAGGNSVTVDPNASETIDGVTTKATTTQFAGFEVVNTGSEWRGTALAGA